MSLLLKNQKLHRFMRPKTILKDKLVVENITNNKTLKNISFVVFREETYFKLAYKQVNMLDTFSVIIYGNPSKCLAEYLATKPSKFSNQVNIIFYSKPADDNFFAGEVNERYELLENTIVKESEDGHPGWLDIDFHAWKFKDLLNSNTLSIGYL